MDMRVLVVGKGGREHALVTALAESATDTEVYGFPGSDAIFQLAKSVDATRPEDLGDFMARERIDLCVAGDESCLVAGDGLAAICAAAGTPCWGPPKQSAQLEASKSFAKEFMARHGIPTGAYRKARSPDEARQAISGYPTVLKFDGLAAGKGVAVCPDECSANGFLDEVFARRKFGRGEVLVEEFLTGPEVSIIAAVADGDYQVFAPARDYKRLSDGDCGPNTGGMGAVASRTGLIGPELIEQIRQRVIEPTIGGLKQDGLPYRGFLYFGLMLTADGPKMLEYNCRFGDPEAQAVLPLISGDLAGYLLTGARNGRLEPAAIEVAEDWSLCLVLASAGYPESSRSGDLIRGLDDLDKATSVYHAGTRRNAEGGFETAGGRVLAVVARGQTRQQAVSRVYAEASRVDFDGCQRRSDIGKLHF